MAAPALPECARPRLESWRSTNSPEPLVAVADLPIYQGDGATFLVEVWAEDGSPADLTGYSAHSQIRLGPADLYPDVIAEWDCSIEGSIVRMHLSADKARLLTYQQAYYYDLELRASDGTPTTVLRGTVLLTPEITRPLPAQQWQTTTTKSA